MNRRSGGAPLEGPAVPSVSSPAGSSMNRVRSGVLIFGGLLPALLFMAGRVFAQEPTNEAGAITGRVLKADGRRPVGQVDVLLVGTGRRAVTDARGRFRFDSVPAGEQRLRVHHLGFQSRELTVHVPPDQLVGVTVQLNPEPVALDPLDVQVESELQIPRLADRGFYYRRELDFGHFYGPQYLTRWSGTRVADVIGRTPGLVLRSGYATGRSPTVINKSRGRECEPDVIVDGIPLTGSWSLASSATEIAAIEVYKGPAQTVSTPFQGSGCGLILVWTWRGPNPFHENADGSISCPERLKRLRAHAC